METTESNLNLQIKINQPDTIFRRDPSRSTLSPSVKLSPLPKKFPGGSSKKKASRNLMKYPMHLQQFTRKIAERVRELKSSAASRFKVELTETQTALIEDLTHLSEARPPRSSGEVRERFRKNFFRGSVLYFNRNLFRLLSKLSKYTCGKTGLLKVMSCLLSFVSEMTTACRCIKPNSKFKIIWDSVNATVSLLVIILVSLSFSLGVSLESMLKVEGYSRSRTNVVLFPVAVLLLVFYLVNIGVNFNLAYYEVGDLIADRRLIARHYIRNCFWLDALSTVPFLLAVFSDSLNYPMTILALLVLLKIKTLKEFVLRIETLVTSDEFSEAMFSLLCLVLSVLFINHFIACLWCLLATDKAGSEGEKNWSNLLNLNPSMENYWMQLYLKGYYWSLTTIATLGYGDIVPQNNVETVVSMMVMMTGSAIFGFTINKIGIILEDINKRNRALRKNLKIANTYMKRKLIPVELQGRVRKYLEFSFKEETIPDIQAEQIFTQRLSSSLIAEVKSKIYGDILLTTPVLKNNFKQETLKSLTQYLKTAHFRPGEIILEKNQIDNKNLYIINEGQIYIELMESKFALKKGNAKKVTLMEPGSSFGEFSFFTDMRANETIRSMGYSTVSFLDREDLLSVLRDIRPEYERFCEIRDRLLLNDFKELRRKCPFCLKTDHPIAFCRTLKYLPSIPMVIARYLFSPEQPRTQKFKRAKKRDFLDPLSNKEANLTGCIRAQSIVSGNGPSLTDIQEESLDNERAQLDQSISEQQSVEKKASEMADEEMCSHSFNKEASNVDEISQERKVLEVPLMKTEGVAELNKKWVSLKKRNSVRIRKEEFQPLDSVRKDSNNSLKMSGELPHTRPDPNPTSRSDARLLFKKNKTLFFENAQKNQEIEFDAQTELIDCTKQDQIFERKIEGDLFDFTMDVVHSTSNYMVEFNMENTINRLRRTLLRSSRRRRTKLKMPLIAYK